MRKSLMFSAMGVLSLASLGLAMAIVAPWPWYVIGGGVCGLSIYLWLGILKGVQNDARTPRPMTDRAARFIGRRFCKVQMNGCMGTSRGVEKWGIVQSIDIGRCERGLVYDGNASQESRSWRRRQGQDTWALVLYADGTKEFEPVWWFIEREDHIEYQI